MIITIIGTMLPFQTTMAFFSLSFVTAVVLSFILYWLNHLKITKYMAALLVALTSSGDTILNPIDKYGIPRFDFW